MNSITSNPRFSAKPPVESSFALLVGLRVGFVVLLLGLWQLLSVYGPGPAYLRPGPWEVLKAFRAIVADNTLLSSVLSSMWRMAIGFGTSACLGMLLGVLLARVWVAKQTLGMLVMALQSLPSICWLPFALIWFGLNESAILAVVILGATFSIAISTENALRNIPPIYLKVGRTLGADGIYLVKDILFFAALPELLGGLKVGWTFAWRSLMAAELIRQDVTGVARILDTGRQFNDLPMMLAAILTILTIGLVVDLFVFGNLERTVRRRWGLEK